MSRFTYPQFFRRGVVFIAAAGAVLASHASPVFAQGGGPFAMAAKHGGDGTYRSFLMALPLASSERGPVGRLEWNLGGRGSVALEAGSEVLDEDLRDEEVKTTGESMMNKGGQASLMYFRYGRPASLAGWYYGVGLGYHEETVTWHRRTSDASVALTDASFVNHNASLKGMTGHGRCGYRYVGNEVPLLIGGYFGLRHFQASVADGPASNSPDAAYTAPMTETDKTRLLNRFRTTPEIGIEVGFVL